MEKMTQNPGGPAIEKEKSGFTRRDFLKMAATAAAVVLLNPDKLSSKQELTTRKFSSSGEKFDPDFIRKTTEKKPFHETFYQRLTEAGSPAQKFFAKWCEINDSIVPQFVERGEWLEAGKRGTLEKNEQGQNVLVLPEDLQLPEMLEFIKLVDGDTFNQKPELREAKADQLIELGQTFEKAGQYLREYLPEIQAGREIANKIGSEFQAYGLALQSGTHKHEREAGSAKLSVAEKAEMDRWFLGETAYQKRVNRIGSHVSSNYVENRRVEILRAYFQALAREGHAVYQEGVGEITKGPIKQLHDRAKEQIVRAIETPEREFNSMIFRRGLEFLKKGMGFDKLLNILTDLEARDKKDAKSLSVTDRSNLDSLREIRGTIEAWKKRDYRTIFEALKIPQMKAELEKTRQMYSWDEVARTELAIARKIEHIVSNLPYEEGARPSKSSDTPSGIVGTQFINCVGASMLGGALLDEVGIKYLQANMPGHALTLLVTSDRKVYWQDFVGSNINFREVKDQDIAGSKNNGRLTKVADIVALADQETDEVLQIGMYAWYEGENGPQINFHLSRPEVGLQCSVLNNVGSGLLEMGKNEEAVEAYRQVLRVSPKYIGAYNNLGNALLALGKKKEALEAYQKFIQNWTGSGKFVTRAMKIIQENQD